MGIIIHNGKILETDNYADGYSHMRAIEKEEEDFKRRVKMYSVTDAHIKKLVREVLLEEGLIEAPKVLHNPYDKEKWELIREAVKGES